MKIMLLLWVLFSVLSAYQAYQDVCYGHDYIFPLSTSQRILSSASTMFFKSLQGSARMVMKDGTALDPQVRSVYQCENVRVCGKAVNIVDVNMDYEGEYSAYYGSAKKNHLLTLRVKDCSIKKQAEYGKSYSFDVYGVEQIEFSPSSFNDSENVILWRRDQPTERAGWTLNNHVLVVSKLTPKDQGFYTLRGEKYRKKYLEIYHISIKETQKSHFFRKGEDFTITFPTDGSYYSLTYQPGHDGVNMPVTLIHSDSGYLGNSEAFKGRMTLLFQGLTIRKLEVKDEGVFRLYDRTGNLAKVVILILRTPPPSPSNPDKTEGENRLYKFLIGPLIFFACCVAVAICPWCTKMLLYLLACLAYVLCCCWCCPSDEEEGTGEGQNEEPPEENSPFSAANQEPQASDSPSPPSDNAVAGDGGGLAPPSGFAKCHTPADVGPVRFQSSAIGVDAPTIDLGFDCLSSDTGTRFEVPSGPKPSDPPLRSDNPSEGVYTSDKVNFL